MKKTKEEALELIRSKKSKGEDLSGLWLTIDNLSGADFSNCDLRGTNFAKATLCNCNFTNADLRGTNFDYCDVTGSDFTGAVANWKTSFKDAMYHNTQLPDCGTKTVDITRPIVQGDITTVSEEVWANEWRVNAPDKENCLSFGGSFIGTLFNVNPFECTLEAINEKKGIYARERKPRNTASFNAGHRYEPYVANQFVEYMANEGYKVTLITDTNMYQHPSHHYLLCDMDYLAIVNGELCVLECKTCNYNRSEEIENLKKRILNKAYYLQVSTYLSVAHLIDVDSFKAKYPEITNSEINTAYVCDCWGFRATDDDMAVIKVERSDAFEEGLLRTLDEMYDCIKNEMDLDLSNSDVLALSDYFRRLYGVVENNEEFNVLTLSDSLKEIVEEIESLQKEKSVYNKQIDNIDKEKLPELFNKLSPLFGDNLHGVLPIKGTDEFYSVDRNPYEKDYSLDTEMLKDMFPETFKKYTNKVIATETMESLLNDLENGVITASEYRKEIESIKDTFDEDRFYAENKKSGKVVAPFHTCYYKKVKVAKDGNDKPVNRFSVKRKTFAKKKKTASGK